jgi:hypothetical protein
LRAEFCIRGCEDRTRVREDEESPLLETIARERLMKTKQAGKRLSVCCGDLLNLETSDSVLITLSSK